MKLSETEHTWNLPQIVFRFFPTFSFPSPLPLKIFWHYWCFQLLRVAVSIKSSQTVDKILEKNYCLHLLLFIMHMFAHCYYGAYLIRFSGQKNDCRLLFTWQVNLKFQEWAPKELLARMFCHFSKPVQQKSTFQFWGMNIWKDHTF